MDPVITVKSGVSRREISAASEQSFLQALLDAGIRDVEAPCGGRGRCGKCVITVTGPVCSLNTREERTLAEEPIPACRFAPVGDCTVTLAGRNEAAVLTEGAAAIEASEGGLGIAVDIGTTTVAALLYDLATGKHLASVGERNAQCGYGADVISRITACGEGKLPVLRDLIRGQTAHLTERLCRNAACSPREIRKMAVAGNTVMEHLFSGLDPTGIGVAPFTPVTLFGDHRKGMIGETDIFLCPCISGYVGGDITAGLLASGGDSTEGLRLYIDIGTNGEMALGNCHGYLTCATAAGPAFEGAEIACGMNGTAGAIDRVWTEDGEISIHVIGEGSAEGLCGSGLVDAVAAMLELNVIDETGRMADEDELPSQLAHRRFDLENGTGAFRLSGKVYLTEKDVRQVQLAKAAICAGAETLLAKSGKQVHDITELVIAGGFGSFMDKYSALRIGLLPPVDPERIRHVGNAALAGAALALTKQGEARLSALAEKCGYLELSSSPDFMERYIECMMFREEWPETEGESLPFDYDIREG